ncbi:helix-turn-helix domain-containing protein [Chitinophaga lutea]|uniref:Helix-turn-helix domain-containing protein n=1 Tax=Chitinophaga lutea TaxID=2488634 RepID=A0A3N4PK58_9BACT|nr:helix-turn-helix domain-containing protein [Chitinophaga lutea]RPE07908.1 helix-turn-helix domain-containing protein [Chitinophaga lutea]
MKHITLLYPEGQCNLSTIACILGTVEIFSRAGEYWVQAGNTPRYRLVVAATVPKTQYVHNLVALSPETYIGDIAKTDLIIIPSAMPGENTADRQVMFDWINRQYKAGAEIASMCSGAFILAATGIMDGRSCSTHWAFADRFRNMYPEVNLHSDKLITDEKGIYTNGGAYSFLNLLIYLVEKYYDRQTAIFCSKVFQIEMDRNSQSSFAIFTGQKQHGDTMVQQAQAYIENNIDEKISVEGLSSKFATGRRNFDRRFIRATGNTPVEYAQRVKIESAKKALESTRKTVNEVMYEVGYSDVKAFREVFRKITGLSPQEYKNRYNKETAGKY